MNNKCGNCLHHENDSRKLNTGRKSIVGNYCTKFAWNLDKIKSWTMQTDRCEICGKQLPRTQLMIHYAQEHKIKAPGPRNMNVIPGDCHE